MQRKNDVEFTDYRQKPSNIKHVSDRFTDSLLSPAVDIHLARAKKLLGGGWRSARVLSSRRVGGRVVVKMVGRVRDSSI